MEWLRGRIKNENLTKYMDIGKPAWSRGINTEVAIRNPSTVILNQPGITCHPSIQQNVSGE